MAEVVRCGRLRWFGHVERKSGDDRVLACRNVVVFRDMWRSLISGKTSDPS